MKRTLILAACTTILFACGDNKKDETKTSENSMTSAADSAAKEKKPQASEMADAKYVDMGKKMSSQFTSGDIDGWTSNFADKSKFYWSSGDSLVGKAAIGGYWKNRRSSVIDSISFSNEIWLPWKINTPQAGPDMPGVWLLSWHMVNVKYKNGKRLQFWVHEDYHFDASDKVDQAVEYIDRAPINKALGMK